MNGAPPLPAAWLNRLRQRMDQPPVRPRVPLRWHDAEIGSIEPVLVAALPARLLRADGDGGFAVVGEVLTPALAGLARALHRAGLAHAWRDEQLPVTGPDGVRLGTVERAVVRQLGIATRAVHLAGCAPDGRHWVQQRAFDKPNDPGLWDTLMGGMVPAGESLEQALARETWEEAGLRLDQLQDLRRGGQLLRRGPSTSGPAGYVVETIDWYRCVLPAGLRPSNQDGEVAQFGLRDAVALQRGLLDEEFTLEAQAVLAACLRT